jgi:hypothetical protein
VRGGRRSDVRSPQPLLEAARKAAEARHGVAELPVAGQLQAGLEPTGQPLETGQVAGAGPGPLLVEPGEVDLGVARRGRRLAHGTETSLVPPADPSAEERAQRPDDAAQPAQRHPEIVERLLLLRGLEPGQLALRLAE